MHGFDFCLMLTHALQDVSDSQGNEQIDSGASTPHTVTPPLSPVLRGAGGGGMASPGPTAPKRGRQSPPGADTRLIGERRCEECGLQECGVQEEQLHLQQCEHCKRWLCAPPNDEPCLTIDLSSKQVVLQDGTAQNGGYLCTSCVDAHFLCCDWCCDTYHSSHVRRLHSRDGRSLGYFCDECYHKHFDKCGMCHTAYIFREGKNPMGQGCCPDCEDDSTNGEDAVDVVWW